MLQELFHTEFWVSTFGHPAHKIWNSNFGHAAHKFTLIIITFTTEAVLNAT